MARTLIVQMTDDTDGSVATETIEFTIDGKRYEIDLSAKNAKAFRETFKPYVTTARALSASRQSRSQGRSARASGKTLFSTLDSEEKDRFRRWASLPTARRIADSRVREWIDAGKP